MLREGLKSGLDRPLPPEEIIARLRAFRESPITPLRRPAKRKPKVRKSYRGKLPPGPNALPFDDRDKEAMNASVKASYKALLEAMAKTIESSQKKFEPITTMKNNKLTVSENSKSLLPNLIAELRGARLGKYPRKGLGRKRKSGDTDSSPNQEGRQGGLGIGVTTPEGVKKEIASNLGSQNSTGAGRNADRRIRAIQQHNRNDPDRAFPYIRGVKGSPNVNPIYGAHSGKQKGPTPVVRAPKRSKRRKEANESMKNSDVYFHLGQIIAEGRRKHTETHTPAQRSAGWEAGYKEKARTLKVPVELREPAPKRSKRRQKARNRASSRTAANESMKNSDVYFHLGQILLETGGEAGRQFRAAREDETARGWRKNKHKARRKEQAKIRTSLRRSAGREFSKYESEVLRKGTNKAVEKATNQRKLDRQAGARKLAADQAAVGDFRKRKTTKKGDK